MHSRLKPGQADFSMHAGPRPVQTEVNATRILLRGSDGHLHLMLKALLMARNLSPRRRADGHPNALEGGLDSFARNKSSTAAAGVSGTPDPRPVAGFTCLRRQERAHWGHAGRANRSSHRLVSGKC